MTNLFKNNKAKREGLMSPQGLIRGDQIFPFCFFIPENLPILLFISPICFIFLTGFPHLLFNLPDLLFNCPRLLFYYSPFAFLLFANSLIIKRFLASYFLLLSYIYIIENIGLPTFRWGGYSEPGGAPGRFGEEKKRKKCGGEGAGTALSAEKKPGRVHQNTVHDDVKS